MLTPTFNTLARLEGDFTFQLPAARWRSVIRPRRRRMSPAALRTSSVLRAWPTRSSFSATTARPSVGGSPASSTAADDDVVVLDDGNMTMLIDRTDGGVRPLTWSEEAERGGFLPLPAVTFFTRVPGPASNPRPVTSSARMRGLGSRSSTSGCPQSSTVTLVVGQGLTRVGVTDEALELRIVARAHRDRSRPASRQHSALYGAPGRGGWRSCAPCPPSCDVVRFDVPAELVPIEAGVLPAADRRQLLHRADQLRRPHPGRLPDLRGGVAVRRAPRPAQADQARLRRVRARATPASSRSSPPSP